MKIAPITAGLAFAVACLTALPSWAADVTLRFASVANESSSWAPAQETFKKELEARTDGRVEVQIFNNNTLGSNREALELAKAGNVDFVLSGLGHATRYASQLNAVIFPYMWKDRDTMFNVLDGEVGDVERQFLEQRPPLPIGPADNLVVGGFAPNILVRRDCG